MTTTLSVGRRHWPVRRLRFLARLNPSRAEARLLPPDADVSFVPMEAVVEGGGLTAAEVRPLESVYSGYTFFRDGDVVVAKITPCFENGKGALASGLVNGVAFGTTELHVLRPGGALDARFLFYVTMSPPFRDAGTAAMTGAAGQKRVPEDFLLDYELSLPPLDDQQAIADFLDRKTATIDALIAKKERLIELIEEKRQAAITRAVTQGLDPDVPMKDSGVEWLGKVPAGWPIVPIRRLFKIANGSTPRSTEPTFWDGPITWVTPNDLGRLSSREVRFSERTLTEAGYRSCGTSLVPAGSLVLSTRAPIGHAGIAAVSLCTNQGCRSLVPTRPADSRYFHYILTAGRRALQALGQGSTFRELGSDDLASFHVPAPPLADQSSLADFLDDTTAEFEALNAKQRELIEKLREYRQTLISAAVTGQIEVRSSAGWAEPVLEEALA